MTQTVRYRPSENRAGLPAKRRWGLVDRGGETGRCYGGVSVGFQGIGRTITSSIWRRIRMGTAASGDAGSPIVRRPEGHLEASAHTMRPIITAGISCFLVLIGCTHVRPTVPGAAPTEPERAASTVPASGSATPPSGTALPAPKTTAQSAAAAAGSSSQSGAGGSSRPKPKPSTLKSPGNAPAAAAGSPAAAAKPTAAPAGDTSARQSTPSAPALDLGALEQRLKETRAIGLFTKLSLKNQVDDLLNQFRAFHGRQGAASLAELRQRYDLLLLKVLSLLQDGDPALAAAISSSREALWGILADPVKFRQTVT